MRIYLDHAATTAVHTAVAQQICEDLRASGVTSSALAANPAAAHTSGRAAAGALAEARARVATALDADPHEVIFTSGGTEACTLTVLGALGASGVPGRRGQVLVSAIEHPAVLDTARTAAQVMGGQAMTLPVDSQGRVELERLTSQLEKSAAVSPADEGPANAVLLSVMLANNETGVVQDLPKIVAIANSFGVPVHTDAVAAVGRIPVSFHQLGVSALSFSGHKIGAPVGIGALLAKRDLQLQPPLGGGRQERGLRSGTQDVIGARALALALELTLAQQRAQTAQIMQLRDELFAGVTQIPYLRPTLLSQTNKLPGTAHFVGEQIDGEALLMALDLAGIDASAGSACHAGVQQPSHVLLAMGHTEEQSRATLRCSLGAGTTASDIAKFLQVLPEAVQSAHRAWRVGRSHTTLS